MHKAEIYRENINRVSIISVIIKWSWKKGAIREKKIYIVSLRVNKEEKK